MTVLRRIGVFAMGLSCLAPAMPAAAATPPYPYHLTSLDAAVPAGYEIVDWLTLVDGGRVFGTAYRCDDAGCLPSVVVHRNGRTTVLHDGIAWAVNDAGVVGGSLFDPATSTEQAAVFSGASVRVIPRRPGETTSRVIALTSRGTALVSSTDENTGASGRYLYDRRGRITPLRYPAGSRTQSAFVNDRDVVAGTLVPAGGSTARAYRLDPGSGRLTILEPVGGDPDTWGMDIDDRGDVLGYSFTAGALERIGVWHGDRFQTYFVEGTPEFPTVSNRLLRNAAGLIVITDCTDLKSYLVPRPNTRVDIADLTADALPAWTLVLGVDARGDLLVVGGSTRFDITTAFVLERD
jgi:hypothetical protein